MPGGERGQDISLVLVGQDGPLASIPAVDATWEEEEDREREEYLGTREEDIDQVFHGWRGTATFHKESHKLAEAADARRTGYYDGEPVVDFVLYITEYVPAINASKTYRYPGLKWGYSGNAPGKSDKVTESVDWQSKERKEV